MFDWLQRELGEVCTAKFYLVDGPSEPKFRNAVLKAKLPLPNSYKEFVIRFGNAQLYRRGINSYQIRVFAGPQQIRLGQEKAYILGRYDSSFACVIPRQGEESQIVEFEEKNNVHQTKLHFDEWLLARCSKARKSYRRWASILKGPPPLTSNELKAIQMRHRIHWSVKGTDSSGDVEFEVANNGEEALRWLTIGVSSKDRRLNGEVYLDISGVGPNETKRIHKDCYKDLKAATELDFFQLPDPGPEDRQYYKELKGVGTEASSTP